MQATHFKTMAIMLLALVTLGAGCAGASHSTWSARNDARVEARNHLFGLGGSCDNLARRTQEVNGVNGYKHSEYSMAYTAYCLGSSPITRDDARELRHKLELKDQRIDRVDEKLDIERDERRHGELTDAIRDRRN